MMKRIITVCIMLMVSISVLKAQDNFNDTIAKKPVFERYSFFSQWQLTLNGGLFSNMGNVSGGFDPSYSFGVVLAKPLNHIWNVRLQYIYGNVDGSEVDINKMFPLHQKGKLIATVNEANLNFTFSLTDLFGGYQPKRFLGVYLLAGGGANFVTGHIEDPTGNTIFTLGGSDELQIRPIASFGAGFRFRLSQSWALNLESAFKFSSQFWDDSHYNGEPSIYNYTSLGVTYDLGICPSVKARIEAEKQLEAERVAAEAERLAREKEECEKAKANEKKLQERIANLEKEMNDKINKELAESKKQQQELQAKLDDIKSKQTTYYALPFSILFPVEGYSVPSSQQHVLKAIAKVINDDKDGEYVVIGFADYTGSDAYNDKLSQKRAESVKNTLVKKYKVNENKLKVDSKGKREAFGDIKFSINRRASIIRTVK